MRARPLAAVLLLLLAACASGAGARPSPGAGASNRLTREELAAVQVETASEAIQRLRPSWLRQREVNSLQGGNNAGSRLSIGGSAPTNEVVVYVDNVRSGGPEVLRVIQLNPVAAIEYLGGSDATTRFGTGNLAGDILITTR